MPRRDGKSSSRRKRSRRTDSDEESSSSDEEAHPDAEFMEIGSNGRWTLKGDYRPLYKCVGCSKQFLDLEKLQIHLLRTTVADDDQTENQCRAFAARTMGFAHGPQRVLGASLSRSTKDHSAGNDHIENRSSLLPRLSNQAPTNFQQMDVDVSDSVVEFGADGGSLSSDGTFRESDESEKDFSGEEDDEGDDAGTMDSLLLELLDDYSKATDDAMADVREVYDNNVHGSIDGVPHSIDIPHYGDIDDALDPEGGNIKGRFPTLRHGRAADFCDRPIPEHLPIHAPANSSTFQTYFDPGDRMLLRLYDLAEHAEAKLYLVEQMLKIVREEVNANDDQRFDFAVNEIPSRRAFFNKMKKKFPVPKPTPTPVPLEGPAKPNIEYTREPRDKAYVIHYDWLDIVDSIYTDHQMWSDWENLKGCVDEKNPFGNISRAPGSPLDEVQSAKWCARVKEDIDEQVRKEREANPNDPVEDYIIEPVSIYTDKTASDKMGRRGVEPVVVQFHRLNRFCRQQPRAKRVLAYIPDCNRKSKVAKKRASQSDEGKGRSVRNYHKCLSVALKSFFEGQGFDRKVVAWVRVGDKMKMCRVFFPFVMFLGDAKSQDVICGRFGTIYCQKPCRSCMTPFKSLPDHLVDCDWRKFNDLCDVTETALKAMGRLSLEDCDKESHYHMHCVSVKDAMRQLQEWSVHAHINAFQDHPLHGHSDKGIMGATPTDPMHVFLHGVLDYVIKTYVDYMTPTEKHVLDKFVDQILVPQRQGIRKDFPRVNFTNGVSNLTQITAEEWAGVAFTLLTFLMTQTGTYIHGCMRKRKFKDFPVPNSRNKIKIKTIREVVPMTAGDRLSLEAEVTETLRKIREKNRKKAEEKAKQKSNSKKKGNGKTNNNARNPKKGAAKSNNKTNSEPVAIESVKFRDDDGEISDEEGRLEWDEKKSKPFHSVKRRACERQHIIWILEKSLSFYCWCRRGAPHHNWFQEDTSEGRSVSEIAQTEVRRYVGAVVEFIPRMTGRGWFIQKIHEMLHVVPDMTEFGSAMNFDCGVWESLLRFVATRPGRLVRSSSVNQFLLSLNERLVESTVLRQAFQCLPPVEGTHKLKSKSHSLKETCTDAIDSRGLDDLDLMDEDLHRERVATEGESSLEDSYGTANHYFKCKPYFQLTLKAAMHQNSSGHWVRGSPLVTVLNKHVDDHVRVQVHPLITNWFHENTSAFTESNGVINFYTEYCRNEVTYRAHPCFHGASWHDWAMIRWSEESREQVEDGALHYGTDLVPAKLLAFFEDPCSHEKKALIHSASRALVNEFHGVSSLCEVWEMEYDECDVKKKQGLRSPRIHCIPVDAIDEAVMVTEEMVGLREYETDKTLLEGYDKITTKLSKNITRRAILMKPFHCWGDNFLTM